MTIWSLHGFLGLPSDFDLVKERCLKERTDLRWNSVDYNHTRELSPSNSLEQWGRNFNHWIQKKDSNSADRVLIGYSLGGRLALQALQSDPKIWKAAILVSAHPGIREGEKPFRAQVDQEWADRFLNENFAKILREWNSQAVFKGSTLEPNRQESDYNRHHLADALKNWSVSRQQDFRNFLAQCPIPILYISGGLDSKYCAIGESLRSSNPRIQFEKIQGSGHRVLFDRPQDLAESILKYLRKS